MATALLANAATRFWTTDARLELKIDDGPQQLNNSLYPGPERARTQRVAGGWWLVARALAMACDGPLANHMLGKWSSHTAKGMVHYWLVDPVGRVNTDGCGAFPSLPPKGAEPIGPAWSAHLPRRGTRYG